MSRDTTPPGGQPFPSTRWSRLIDHPTGRRDDTGQGMENLAGQYFRPIVAYIRARTRTSEDEATELAQEFFVWMIERDFLDRADRTRGSFRGYIKKSLSRFLIDQNRRRVAKKRGGNNQLVSLVDREENSGLEISDKRNPGGDELLDKLWRKEVLTLACQGLREELEKQGRETVFAVFRDYFLGEEDLEYDEIAERYGISPAGVSNSLMYAKKRYRAQLQAVVLDSVHRDEDLRAELNWLFREGPP